MFDFGINCDFKSRNYNKDVISFGLTEEE